eukprot:1107744-Lingulodinium_polyedra.AAC.1
MVEACRAGGTARLRVRGLASGAPAPWPGGPWRPPHAAPNPQAAAQHQGAGLTAGARWSLTALGRRAMTRKACGA